MKLATFTHDRVTRIGIVETDRICDLSSVPGLPTDMIELLEGGAPALQAVRKALHRARKIPFSDVQLEAPVLRPRKFLGLGGSYESHLKETSHLMPRPAHQTWFNKQVTCVNGPCDPIEMPRVSSTLDYEGELALIIGRRGRHVRAAEAMDMIAGLTICND